MLRLLPALAALALVVPLAAATPAPKVGPKIGIASFEQLAKPLPLPYDERAGGAAAVAAARARAIKANKRLLIDLGGNWCLDCRLLAGVMERPELKPFLARHFEIVVVDVGRFDKNQSIPAAYGIKDRLAGVPAVLVVDPKPNRLVNRGRETALADARSLTPQALADWLAQWAK